MTSATQEAPVYYENCGNRDPHDHHVYELDGEWRECAGIPSRIED